MFIAGVGLGLALAGLFVLWHERLAVKRGTVVLWGREYRISELE